MAPPNGVVRDALADFEQFTGGERSAQVLNDRLRLLLLDLQPRGLVDLLPKGLGQT